MDVNDRRINPTRENQNIEIMDTPFRVNYWRALLYSHLDGKDYFFEQMKANSTFIKMNRGDYNIFKLKPQHNSLLSLIGEPDDDLQERTEALMDFLGENEIIPVFAWQNGDNSPSFIREFLTDSYSGQKFSVQNLIDLAIKSGRATNEVKVLFVISQSNLLLKMWGDDNNNADDFESIPNFPISLIVTDQCFICCYDTSYPMGWLLLAWDDIDGTNLRLSELDKPGKMYSVYTIKHTDEFADANHGHLYSMLVPNPNVKDVRSLENTSSGLSYLNMICDLQYTLLEKYDEDEVFFELDSEEKIEKFRNKFLKYYENKRD